LRKTFLILVVTSPRLAFDLAWTKRVRTSRSDKTCATKSSIAKIENKIPKCRERERENDIAMKRRENEGEGNESRIRLRGEKKRRERRKRR